MPIQQKLPPPVLFFRDFAGWEYGEQTLRKEKNLKDFIIKIRIKAKFATIHSPKVVQ